MDKTACAERNQAVVKRWMLWAATKVASARGGVTRERQLPFLELPRACPTRDCGREVEAADDTRAGAAWTECVLPGRDIGVGWALYTGVIATGESTCGASVMTIGRVNKGGSAALGCEEAG